MMNGYPDIAEEQRQRAIKNLQKLNEAECPENMKEGRSHEMYFFAVLDKNTNLHFCKTCGITREVRVRT